MILETINTDTDAVALIRAAAARLTVDLPLIGLTLLGRAIRVREWAGEGTYTGTAEEIRYNPLYVKTQDPKDTRFDLIAAWLHVFGRDYARQGHRIPLLWKIAVEISVVQDAMVMTDRSAPSKGSIVPPKWAKGLTKEKIYDVLLAHTEKQEGDTGTEDEDDKDKKDKKALDDLISEGGGRVRSGDSGAPPPGTEFLQALRGDTASASVVEERFSSARGKTAFSAYGDKIKSRLGKLMSDNVPWERLIIGHLQGLIGPGETSWSPPNLRYWDYDIILPRTRTRRTDKLVIGMDTSASMTQGMVDLAASSITGAARRAKEVIVVCFDQVIREVVRTKHPEEIMKLLKLQSGSHAYTDARPLMEIVNTERPSATVIFTDGFVALPETPPEGDLLWALVPDTSTTMKYGEVVLLEEPW